MNKQIFQEAFLHFYQSNVFYLPTIYDLHRFLRNLPAYRRQHLTQLAFNYTCRPSDDKVAPGALKFLASLPHLRKLHIYFKEGRYYYPLPPSVEARKANILKIPGVTTLRTIRGLEEVVFSGECALIEEMLKPIMESPISTKRKGVAVEVEDWGRPKRAARAKKVQKK